jgi:phosphatidylserine/phosphatidylglycerophosphate/cardiolipin synthase-like enzyme
VHAKIMVIDDMLLRVGSSNLNNRSLSFYTECDLVLEAARAGTADDRLRTTIRSIRNDLLCEHLGLEPGMLDRTLEARGGSLLAAIEQLKSDGRTLRRFDPEEVTEDESALAENELLDPERRAAGLYARLAGGVRDLAARVRHGGH